MHVGHGSSPNSSTNGTATNGTVANGSSRGKGRANDSNGFSNGDAPKGANGDVKRKKLYQTHDKEEMVRLMMQALRDMGYSDSASALEQESRVELESPSVAALRFAVLNGEWNDAELLLLGDAGETNGNGLSLPVTGMPLKPDADVNALRLALRRQKYLELLEQRDHGKALMVLRHGLTPLRPPVDQLHTLSGLMVCPTADDLRKQAKWRGAEGGSRRALLDELSQSIHHSVIVPPSRLADLLSQTRRAWIGNCIWHNPVEPISLFVDHTCDRDPSPPHVIHTLEQVGEVFHVAFSNSGRYLAVSGEEKAATIYEVGGEWDIKFKLGDHRDKVPYLAWSPDDSLLVTCSGDRSAKLWDMKKGACIATVARFEAPVTTAAWLPDGSGFFVGTLDIQNPLLLWRVSDLMEKSMAPALALPAKDFRVQDIAITPDGSKLLAISAGASKGHLSVFDLVGAEREEIFRLRFESAITCVSISRDGRHALLNLSDCKIQCVEVDTMDIVQHYEGQQQGQFIIRSTLGGVDENLVLSGSEDGKVYVFHRDRGTLIEALDGHKAGDIPKCVNAVAWNPTDMCMFASCGDDGVVKIWSKVSTYTPATTRRTSSDLSFTPDALGAADDQPVERRAERFTTRQGSTSASSTLH